MADFTCILNAIERGDPKAADELLPLVYEELRILAAQKLSHEPLGQTLQATALVHEAYLRLVGTESQHWDNKGHFFKAAAEAMRRILIDNARRKQSFIHGGVSKRIDLNDAFLASEDDKLSGQLMALDEVLTKLAEKDKVKSDLVKLRYFAGLTGEQAAKVLGISEATAERYWDYSRSWLRLEMADGNSTI